MQWLWTVLSPIFWLCSVLLNPWVAASLLGAITTAGVAFRRLRLAQSSNLSRSKPSAVVVVTSQQEVIKGILQVFPIHPTNGWALSGVVNSVNVFSRVWDVPSSPQRSNGLSWKVFASSVILECPPHVALSRSINYTDLPLWVEGLSLPGSQLVRTSPEKDGDLIRLNFTKEDPHQPKGRWIVDVALPLIKTAVATLSSFLDNEESAPVNLSTETLSRFWYSKPGLHYLHTVPQELSSLPYHWSSLLFTGVRDSKNICLATFVVLPRQHRQSHVTTMIANQLCALRQHMVMKNLKVYPSSNRTSRPPSLVDNQVPPSPRSSPMPPTRSVVSTAPQGQSLGRSRRNMSEPVISANVNRRVRSSQSLSTSIREIPPPTPPSPPKDSRDVMYLEMAKEKADKLIGIALATESDGWVMVGTKQNIRVMKLPPKEGGNPVNCVKGTGLVNAPPDFIMHFLKDDTYTTQLDDLLKEVRVIHVISPAVQIVHMLYKGVWPTTPRDFGVLNISGKRDSQTWLSGAISVDDRRIPNEKGFVRAQIEAGGYVIRAVPGKPDVSEVTYIAQVDLKGSIPGMVMNKIADSQPQCVNKLRGIVEPLYARLNASPQALTEYKEKFEIAMIVEEEVDSAPPTHSQAHPSQSQPPGATHSLRTTPYNTITQAHPSQSQPPGATHSLRTTPYNTITQAHPSQSQPPGATESITSAPALGNGVVRQNSLFDDDGPIPESQENGAPLLLRREGSAQSGISTSSGSPASLVVMETVNEDEFQFQTPQFSDDVVPNPCLVQQDHRESSPKEQANSSIEAFTPDEIPSDNDSSNLNEPGGGNVISLVREGRGARDGRESSGSVDSRRAHEGNNVFMYSPSPRLELKLPPYPRPRSSSEGMSSDESLSRQSWATHSLTAETIGYPRQGSGGVDFRTMANQTAARVLEEVFHVSSIDVNNPATFVDQNGGWKFSGFEKDILMLRKKNPDSPFDCFIGKGVVDLPPQSVYDSIRNPQLRFTYDNMLKELHIVKQIEEGLYILHLHHETTQCFMKQSRDFCLLVSERSEPNKKLLIGTSIEVPECPPKPDVHRGKVLCSGWVVEPYRSNGKLQTEITYLLQVDMGGVPSTLVNFISQRQPLAVAYLRDYLISTSLDLSHREDKDTSL